MLSIWTSLNFFQRKGLTHTRHAGFCPEFKSIGANGPLSLKKVGHFRKYGALVNFPAMTLMVYQHYLDTVRIFIISAFKYLGLKMTDNVCKL